MKMNHIYKCCLLAAVASLFASCENFLSELPTKGTNQPITSLDQLNGLLEGLSAETIMRENNITSSYSTDDGEIPVSTYDAYPTKFSTVPMYYYTFNINDIPNEAADNLWTGQFSLIYRANLIMEYVDKVSGDQTLKARIKAEAHFLRAYSYWVLANYYCLPYATANLQEQGLPQKLSTNVEEDYTQMTIQQTYELIDADIAEALKVDTENSEHSWRADRATVNAFLSRYYMFRGEYDKAITAADYALDHKGTTQLKNYNTLVAGTPAYYTSPLDTIYYCETNNYSAAQMVNWPEHFYIRLAYTGNQFNIPSTALLNLYDQENDMRFKWSMHPKGNRRFSVPDIQIWRYSFFSDGRYAWSGPTIQEVMLNKAECMLRKATPDITGALTIVNELRDNRIKPGAPGIHLTAATKDEALTKVLQERRRELPFGFRWWDIRRFAVNETTIDDVTVTHNFHPVAKGVVDMTTTQNFVLQVGSRRYAIPINGVDIDASKGMLKQNTY